MTILIVLILMLTIVTPLYILPNVNAQLSIKTYAHLSVGPNPIGVGQTLFVVMWLSAPPPAPLTQTSDIRAIPYTNFTITVTDPDNIEKVMGPYTSDSTGSVGTRYVPDKLGTYTFVFNFGGETIYGQRLAGDPMRTDYYEPSTSHIVTINVQEEPLNASPGAPLPTEYWTRPIDAQNYEWSVLGGNWLGVPLQFASGCNPEGTFNPYSTAPKAAHILWTISQAFGGIVGDNFNDSAYYTGLSYQEKWNPPTAVVLNGRLYYHTTAGPAATVQGLSCVDLATGKEIWFLNDTTISFGQLWKVETINVHGVHAFLWNYRSGTSTLYDAYTGRILLTVSNCQSATKVAMGENGELMVYTMNAGRGWLSLWNSSKCLSPNNDLTWAPSLTRTYEWSDGLMWNVTIPIIAGQTWTQFGDGVIITTTAFREANPPVRKH